MDFKFRHLPITRHQDTTAVLEQLQPIIGGLIPEGGTNTSLASNVSTLETEVATLEAKAADSGWKAVEFENSWKNTGGAFMTAAYRKQGNTVRLRGVVEGGASGSVAFTLPAGFRPTATSAFAGAGGSTADTKAQITTGGAVALTYSVTGIVAVDGVTFTVD